MSDQTDRVTLRRAEDLLLMVLTGREREAAVLLETVPDGELRPLTHALVVHAANAYAQGNEIERVIAAFTEHYEEGDD